MERLCVFCGSSNKAIPKYRELAVELGHELVRQNIKLVYGGASVGLMGLLAETVMAGGGEVYGFIPKAMVDSKAEVPYTDITKLEIVKDMHERKQKMYKNADAFCALPGGIGTLEEVAEVFTWSVLGYHGKKKPITLLDDGKYWDLFSEFTQQMVAENFLDESMLALVGRFTNPAHALRYIDQNLPE